MNQKRIIGSVMEAIESQLPRGYPTLQKTANVLGTSPRTLQRRMRLAGLSYGNVVLACRLERARHRLAESRRRVSEIAAELGYADPSSFSRFFIRMTGETPRAFRRRSRQQLGHPR